jgi:hypothetical protein
MSRTANTTNYNLKHIGRIQKTIYDVQGISNLQNYWHSLKLDRLIDTCKFEVVN